MAKDRPEPLTDEERRQGYVRRDETGKLLRAGWMSDAEFRAYWTRLCGPDGWRARLWGKEPPKVEGVEFVWDNLHGWVRKNDATRKKR